MKTTIQLNIAHFPVPTRVAVIGNIDLKNGGFNEQRTIHLSELDIETLEELCTQFRINVFAVANSVKKDVQPI